MRHNERQSNLQFLQSYYPLLLLTILTLLLFQYNHHVLYVLLLDSLYTYNYSLPPLTAELHVYESQHYVVV